MSVMKLSHENRIVRRKPHRNRAHWCDGCDAQLLHDGQRCPNCGYHDGNKTTDKKIGPMLSDWVEEDHIQRRFA